MKLYTKSGDSGKTSIIGGDRIDKDHIRIQTYGTIDELNSIFGIVNLDISNEIRKEIQYIQSNLFEIGSELASKEPKNTISDDDIKKLEDLIDKASEKTPPLKSFILPGGSRGSSYLHLARTVTRRAERNLVGLMKIEKINPNILIWLNRLSDLCFAWARLENYEKGIKDIPWTSRSKST